MKGRQKKELEAINVTFDVQWLFYVPPDVIAKKFPITATHYFCDIYTSQYKHRIFTYTAVTDCILQQTRYVFMARYKLKL
jgi:hypothetical protein